VPTLQTRNIGNEKHWQRKTMHRFAPADNGASAISAESRNGYRGQNRKI
jgi:hypothetical protein